jgi:antitoxin HigA-1
MLITIKPSTTILAGPPTVQRRRGETIMRERKRQPIHPGGILKRQYLEPLQLSVARVAEALKVSRKTFSKIVDERGAVTPDTALRLSRAFETTPELWLNLQQNFDLWQTSHGSKGWKAVHSVTASAAA